MLARPRQRDYSADMAASRRTGDAPSGTCDLAEPAGLQDFLGQAERALALRRVYLFGSRARGDARTNSDLDLAFEHSSSPAEWADFVNIAREEAPLLLDLDLIDLA